MRNKWSQCKNVLVIRPDNMGDLLMSSPAIRALKESFGCKITVLTSSMASAVAKMIPEIDEVMVFDLPWVKTKESLSGGSISLITDEIRSRNFDAAVIFTVYSQNPLPTAFLAYLAGIPLRLAYCRENPYELLTDWVPDQEPFSFIRHQVRRDLELVKCIGADSRNEHLSLVVDFSLSEQLRLKLNQLGVQSDKSWIILHPGVSEKKREYPIDLWVQTGRELVKNFQLLITGAETESSLTTEIQQGIGRGSFSLAGKLSLQEFVLLLKQAPLVVSVNTGTIHLASACATPVIVLYALTNPQHSPWKVPGRVLTFDVQEDLRSRNEVIKFVNEKYTSENPQLIVPEQIIEAVNDVFAGKAELIPEMIEPGLFKMANCISSLE